MKNYILLFILTGSLPLLGAAAMPETDRDAVEVALKLLALKKCPAPILTDVQIKETTKLAQLVQQMHEKRRRIPQQRIDIKPTVARKLF